MNSNQLVRIPPNERGDGGKPIVVIVQGQALEPARQRRTVTVQSVIDAYLSEQGRFFQGVNYENIKRSLRLFAEMYGTKPVSECSQRDLGMWLLANPAWKSPHTQRMNMHRVVAAFLWAEESRIIEWSPYHLPRISRKCKPQRLPDFLRAEEAEAMLQFCRDEIERAKKGTKRYGPCQRKIAAARRDLMIVQLGLWAGLRCSEISKLRLEDVDLAGRSLFISQAKGGKDRYVPIGAKLLDALRAWVGDRTTGYLVDNAKGQRLPHVTLYWRVVRIARRMKLPRRFHPHSLRHTFSTRLLEEGADIRQVQELLGHASVTTTMAYLHVTQQRLRAAVDRL